MGNPWGVSPKERMVKRGGESTLCAAIIKSGLMGRDTYFFEQEELMTLYCGLLTFGQKHELLTELNGGTYNWMTPEGRRVFVRALSD